MPSSTLNAARFSDEEISQLEKLAIRISGAVKQIRAENQTTKARYSDAPCQQAMRAADGIQNLLRGPKEYILDTWLLQMVVAAMVVFDEFKGFDHIPAEGAISFADLAQELDADVNLILRIINPLVASKVLRLVDGDKVAHSSKSKSFIGIEQSRRHNSVFNKYIYPGVLGMPDYFAKYGRKEPTTRHHTLFTFAQGCPELTIWECMRQQGPENVQNFMDGMSVWSGNQPKYGTYNFGWIVDVGDKQSKRPLLVDVGASNGHVTRAILKATPGLDASRCVLQDLPEVIEELERLDPEDLRGCKKIAIDFHKEQPVKDGVHGPTTGALLYFIRTCLHDYGDDESVQILSILVDAMANDSRLLILEQVLSNPPKLFGSVMDLSMMVVGGKERNKEQWADLTARSGLRILNIQGEGALMSAIECVKVKAHV